MNGRMIPLAFLVLGACVPATRVEAPAPAADAAPPVAPTPSAEPAQPDKPEPPGLGISESRPIEDMHRRTIGFSDAGVWISNEFDGGRVSDAWQESDAEFAIQLRPENFPINASAWYAFKVWAEAPRTIRVRLTYENGRHRYWPEARKAGEPWTAMDSSWVSVDREAGEATLRLQVGPDTL